MEQAKAEVRQDYKKTNRCPDCGGPIKREGGCMSCAYECGWCLCG